MITATEMTIAARMYGMDYGQFSFALKCGRLTMPPMEEIHRRIVKQQKSGSEDNLKKDLPVCQYTLKGELVRTYDTIKQAAEVMGGHRGNIIAACEGRYRTTRGFQWRYLNDDPPGKLKTPPAKKKAMREVDKVCVCGKPFKGKGSAKYCCDECRTKADLINRRKAASRYKKKKKAQNRK